MAADTWRQTHGGYIASKQFVGVASSVFDRKTAIFFTMRFSHGLVLNQRKEARLKIKAEKTPSDSSFCAAVS